MLKIRLQRIGKRKEPVYRLIISESARDTQAKNLEILGTYNPRVSKPEDKIKIKSERIKYWLSCGAQMSNTIYNLLLKEGLVSGKKRRSVKISNKKKAKIAEAAKNKAADDAKAEAAKANQEADAKAEAAKAGVTVDSDKKI